MPLELSEVKTFEAFRPVVDVELEAYDVPLNSCWEVYRGPTADETAERQWGWSKAFPESHWVKVTDTETNEIVGAAEWVVHMKNPFETSVPGTKATWWPENDPRRDIGTQMFDTFLAQRPNRMNRPHVLLNICFVGQKFRRRGAGRLLMKYGTDLADKLGLEAFVEASSDGKPLYEVFGFHPVNYYLLDAKTAAATPEWDAMQKKILPTPFKVWFMWRPVGGKFVPGETMYSWEAESK